jgi:hypothetical protein
LGLHSRLWFANRFDRGWRHSSACQFFNGHSTFRACLVGI